VSTLNNAVLRQGDFVFGPVSLQVNAGERIGITGPNGAGKSTLLRALLGRAALDSGTASLGASVAIGEIDQARASMTGERSLVEIFALRLPHLAAGHVNRAADALSPGERTRAGLALLQATGVNLLVLDEPTNHLDLAAIEQLEEALEAYTGTLLLVTHDRRMLATVRLDRHWSVEGGRVTEQPTGVAVGR
jgi:ATPase subunit of ABC transporter with duplicated ATPase domains